MDKEKIPPYAQLVNMKLHEEITLETSLADTLLIVRAVPNGWLYIYIRSDSEYGNFLKRTMTSTFVPR